MRWATYFAVLASVLSVGLALGVSMPLVSLRLGTANLMRLCLWAGAISIGLLAVLPSYPVWLLLRRGAFGVTQPA